MPLVLRKRFKGRIRRSLLKFKILCLRLQGNEAAYFAKYGVEAFQPGFSGLLNNNLESVQEELDRVIVPAP